MPQLDALNSLSAARATELFTACCGSARWVAEMVARRPFGSREALLSAADATWAGLGPDDWREAFRTLALQSETGAVKVSFDYRPTT